MHKKMHQVASAVVTHNQTILKISSSAVSLFYLVGIPKFEVENIFIP